jgi:hypothetical protein
MYQQIFIENQPVFVPCLSYSCTRLWWPSTYFIRGFFSRGHYGFTSFYARLGELEVKGEIRNVGFYFTDGVFGCDRVFVFDAPDSLEIMKLFVRLNDECVKGKVRPLPDLEFVHPAAHALIYSLGKFSGDSEDCFLRADPASYNLNQKIR